MMPTLGVVVLSSDGEWDTAVRGLLAQTVPPVSITVVTWVAGRPPADARVRVAHCLPTAAAAVCRREALRTPADFVACLGGHDEALPGWVEAVVTASSAAGGPGRAGVVRYGAVRLRPDGVVGGVLIPGPGPNGREGSGRAGGAGVRSGGAGPAAPWDALLSGAGLPGDGPGVAGGPVAGGSAGAGDGAPCAVRRDLLTTPAAQHAGCVAVPRLLVRQAPQGGAPAAPSAGSTAPGRRPARPALVSVVVPVRDGAATLPAQLRALAEQTYTGAVEVLVVDNGSADGTRDVAGRARAWLPGLRIVDAGGRPGEAYARNTGVAAARGDFVAFCDADDVAAPGWLSGLVAAAGGADLVGGALDVGLLSPAYADEQPVPLTEQGDFLPFARGANCAAWRDVLGTVGGWDESYRGGGEDMDLSWRAQLCGYRLAYAPDALMHYRLREGLAALARQKWNYGLSGARLYARYRHAGFARRRSSVAAANWLLLLVRLPDLVRSRRLRRRWVRYAARLAGFLAGSVRQGVLYP
ncbi:glycosyltransferase [Streptomyces lavendulocolor]|uniref:Glycosyltransferase n=1 Tax=Streptomyces lavendulocolor TaxID=67316 RepID=A0ABV2W960_9ACTN